MTFEAICLQERASMRMRHLCGYGQYDDHIWRWLNHHLNLRWSH